jgi:heme exporter protein D
MGTRPGAGAHTVSFESFQAFLDMGGHGTYVWWSYGIGLGVLGYNLFRPLRARRRVLHTLRRSAAQPPNEES